MAKRSTVVAASVAALAVVVAGIGVVVAVAGGQSTQKQTVTVRLWDDQVQKAYDESFAAFEKKNPDIDVKTTLVPWADYFTKLRTDIAGGDADDVFWVNAGNFEDYASNGDLVDVTDALGASAAKNWQSNVVDQYTQGGKLWGVPQLADPGIGVFYNKELLAKAGVDPAELDTAHWSPDPAEDTLLPILQKLTLDSAGRNAADPAFDPDHVVQYGYNAANDLNAIYINYLGSNGAALQKGDQFVFDSPAGVRAFQYVVDLIDRYHVAPAAADTNTNGDFSRDQFTQGKLALFQTGSYNLANVQQGAAFRWGISTIPAGPDGAISVTNGVIAAGNAHSKHPAAVKKVLSWLGSEEGSAAIGAGGSASPAVVPAQQSFLDYWKSKGIDVSPLYAVLKNGSVQAPQGAKWAAAQSAFGPTFEGIFDGSIPVGDGLRKAQHDANAAIGAG
ncbi:ABC transporter substrate-binding protein [Leifsonia sp. NPDC058230]|uniref:ABC transporter substrate-binding protein n=1 Tax=Leifsonia sp. NPDC058230 TaxID=3346391 RepID=UPI0036DC8C73